MTSVFVVNGTSGEWSDRREWSVAAFSSEEEAKRYIRRVQRLARVLACFAIQLMERYGERSEPHVTLNGLPIDREQEEERLYEKLEAVIERHKSLLVGSMGSRHVSPLDFDTSCGSGVRFYIDRVPFLS